jgi:hypothetical protein
VRQHISLVENTQDEFSINKRTSKHHVIFMDNNDQTGAYIVADLSVQRVLDSEDGHYLGMNSSLSAELFATEHCTIAMIRGQYNPIAYKTAEEARIKLGIPEEETLYMLPFNVEGDAFDHFVEEIGVDNIVALFDQENPFSVVIDALNHWNNARDVAA